jgi:hypothetical protein
LTGFDGRNSDFDIAVQEGSVKKSLIGLVALIVFVPVFALAQRPSEEKVLVGHVQRVDESGTQLTLKDGTNRTWFWPKDRNKTLSGKITIQLSTGECSRARLRSTA